VIRELAPIPKIPIRNYNPKPDCNHILREILFSREWYQIPHHYVDREKMKYGKHIGNKSVAAMSIRQA
jgi:hypothetical protein